MPSPARFIHLWLLWIPATVCLGISLGGPWAFLPLLTLTTLHPAADFFAKRIGREQPLGSHLSEALVLLYPFVQTTALVVFLARIGANPPSTDTLVVKALSFGLMSGATGITVAHELVHRSARWQRGLGVWLLSQVLFSHYRVEHVFGHHSRVATPEDPASARRGEWIYTFWVRWFFVGLLNAWKSEARRLPRLSQWGRHRIIHYCLLQSALLIGAFALGSLPGLIFFIVQALAAVLLLGLIDYVEHYGLERKRLPNGGYEAIGSKHSWDSDHRFTNAFLINLGRHADHHTHPRKTFGKLINRAEAPLLPYGYSTMLMLALVPPFFFKRMDALIET